jgi:hypothetical protein
MGSQIALVGVKFDVMLMEEDGRSGCLG